MEGLLFVRQPGEVLPADLRESRVGQVGKRCQSEWWPSNDDDFFREVRDHLPDEATSADLDQQGQQSGPAGDAEEAGHRAGRHLSSGTPTRFESQLRGRATVRQRNQRGRLEPSG